ncbi:MAG: hypothetical protein IT452_10510 [Planctomycetia bacterium]|nr:hypothetical protein [Planctomycetia bacterium]
MLTALTNFHAHLAQYRALGALYKALIASPPAGVDPSDVLRAELVFAVSAFDFFIHELVRLGVSQAFLAPSRRTAAFKSFKVELSSVEAALTSPGTLDWLNQEVLKQHGWQSFQKPDKVAGALSLITSKSAWPSIAKSLGKPEDDVKTELRLIVDRRNKIAHEADVDPSYPGARWPITGPVVDRSLDFLDALGDAVYAVVK